MCCGHVDIDIPANVLWTCNVGPIMAMAEEVWGAERGPDPSAAEAEAIPAEEEEAGAERALALLIITDLPLFPSPPPDIPAPATMEPAIRHKTDPKP